MSGRWPVVKIIGESLLQHDEKRVVPTPLSGIRVGKRRRQQITINIIYMPSAARRSSRS
jgi:hypothetical protein